MNLRIDSFSASFNYHSDSFKTIVERLETEGYRPLIRKLAQELCHVVGGNLDDLHAAEALEELEQEISSDVNRRKLLGLEKLGYKWGLEGIRGLARVPELKGELFLADDSENVLFLTMLDIGSSKPGKDNPKVGLGMLRVGIVGADPDSVLLDLFKGDIASSLQEGSNEISWTQDNIENIQFQEFLAAESNALHALAAGITEREMKSAKALESSGLREVATTIRRSGVILAKELLRSKPDTAADTVKYVDQLIQADLLRQEYVVICSKSGTHVNRVEHRETIDQMAKLGVLCSCGKRISDEAIEGLLATDVLLPKMLDKNYWMTVSVVRSLMNLGVSPEKIILNPSTVNDDVEILADLDGTLLMFNLKDAEYGIPHALSFTTRIGMHRPDMAFLVSTRGVSAEVKDHFKRVKLDTQMVYIANMLQLDATLKKVVEGVRMHRVRAWFDTFQSMMDFGLTPLLLQRLQFGKSETKVNTESIKLKTAAPEPQATMLNAVADVSMPVGAEQLPEPQPAHVEDVQHEPVLSEQVQPEQVQHEHTQQHAELVQPAIQQPVEQLPQEPVLESPIQNNVASEPVNAYAAFLAAAQPPAVVEEPAAVIYTAPEPITESLETSYTHEAFDAPAVAPTENHAAPFVAQPTQAPASPASFFSRSTFDDDDVSDSDVAVSELEDLISEARESKIGADIEHVIPASAMEFFADESNGSNGNNTIHQEAPPQQQINPYRRVMEMLNPPVVTSVIIDEAPLQTNPSQPLSAMDILDGVLEAVASSEAQSAVEAEQAAAASTGNVFTEQRGRYAAAKAAQEQNQAEAQTDDEPVATY
jgi:hypothetical protein